ncbi:MAG: SDR family oxidoreductase [Chloroflexi bacterium]|nr:SDR family oxidoreductase [Chloroflexota bacterium]
MRLQNRVAIVTGGAYGLGKAFVQGYAREGAKVLIADIDLPAAQRLEKELANEGKQALAVMADVSRVTDTQEMAKKAATHFGRIDILVNNAAVFGRVKISKMVPFHELTLGEWQRVMDVNATGPFLCCRAVFPYMKAQSYGKIVNIVTSQFYATGGNIKYAHYIASKGALIGLTRALAREMGEYNVTVNGIAPGSTLTEDSGNEAAVKEREGAIAGRCLKRVEYPEDVVGAAIFLASPESDFITGQILAVNGGSLFI